MKTGRNGSLADLILLLVDGRGSIRLGPRSYSRAENTTSRGLLVVARTTSYRAAHHTPSVVFFRPIINEVSKTAPDLPQ